MERLLRFVVVAFPVTMPSNDKEATDAAASTTPSDTNVVATNTVAISEMTPQDNVGLDIQSQEEFRSAASETGQSEHQSDEVFSEKSQPQLHVADRNPNTSSKSLKSSREVRSLCSVNNAGRKESLAISESSRSKRPPLDATRRKYEDALSKVNKELAEFLDTYPQNVHVPVEERPDTKAKYKTLRMRRAALESEAFDLRALFDKQGMTQERKALEQTLKDIDALITAIKFEHFEYLSHGSSTLAGQHVAPQNLHNTPSRSGSQTSASHRRKILKAIIQGQEEKEMAEIQMERNRSNALLDVRESDAQLRAQAERAQINRILLDEEDALNNSVHPITNQGNILPTASSPHVAFSVQHNSGCLP